MLTGTWDNEAADSEQPKPRKRVSRRIESDSEEGHSGSEYKDNSASRPPTCSGYSPTHSEAPSPIAAQAATTPARFPAHSVTTFRPAGVPIRQRKPTCIQA